MSAFGDAFKAARAAGKKTFTFNGKSYHTRTKEDEAKAKAKPAAKPDVSKATAGPAVYEKRKAPPMDDATKARVERNAREQEATRGEDMSKYAKKMPNKNPPAKDARFGDRDATKGKPEIIKPVDNSSKKIGEDGKLKNVNPVDMPERRRLGPKTGAPEIIKTSDKKDDTSLSVSERIKNARERARSSNTGTDKRSVTQRIKDSLGMMSGGKVKGYGPGGSIGKGYGKARGAKACKMR